MCEKKNLYYKDYRSIWAVGWNEISLVLVGDWIGNQVDLMISIYLFFRAFYFQFDPTKFSSMDYDKINPNEVTSVCDAKMSPRVYIDSFLYQVPMFGLTVETRLVLMIKCMLTRCLIGARKNYKVFASSQVLTKYHTVLFCFPHH